MKTMNVSKAAGDLDPSFGEDGKLIVEKATSLVLLEDGGFLTASAPEGSLIIAKLLSDGKIDEEFGEKGFVRHLLIAGLREWGIGIQIQQDRKIIIYGSLIDNDDFIEDAYIIRLHPDGSLDITFGTDGMVYMNDENTKTSSYSLAVQPDGKIVYVGRLMRGFDNYDALIRRFHMDGSPDLSFNKTGTVLSGKHWLSSVVILPGPKLLFAGSQQPNLLFKCYLDNGEPDISFGNNGVLTAKVGAAILSEVTGLQLHEEGTAVATGWGRIDSHSYPMVTRILIKGEIDKSFNGGEPVLETINGIESQNTSIAVQADMKIVVVGSSPGDSASSNFTMMRFHPDGRLDLSFGNAGGVITDFGGLEYGAKVLIQHDKKIVLSGKAFHTEKRGYCVARYLNN